MTLLHWNSIDNSLFFSKSLSLTYKLSLFSFSLSLSLSYFVISLSLSHTHTHARTHTHTHTHTHINYIFLKYNTNEIRYFEFYPPTCLSHSTKVIKILFEYSDTKKFPYFTIQILFPTPFHFWEITIWPEAFCLFSILYSSTIGVDQRLGVNQHIGVAPSCPHLLNFYIECFSETLDKEGKKNIANSIIDNSAVRFFTFRPTRFGPRIQWSLCHIFLTASLNL